MTRMFSGAVIVLMIGVVVWSYQAIIKRPPSPNVGGFPDGLPVTSPRIKLRDGRHLAYRERGIPKEKADYKVIIVHGFDNSKDMAIVASQELIREMKIYFLSFDRAGYGESDPNPSRSVKSEALDIQELADQLQIGSKFYVLGISMGGYPTWGCLKYIPDRLAGAALVVPIVSYWWPSFPSTLSMEAYKGLYKRDQCKLGIAHYTPRLLYWWMTQKWFPSSSYSDDLPELCSPSDKEILKKMAGQLTNNQQTIIRQQGVFESLCRDLMVGYGNWDFDPMELSNPFPGKDRFVHIWQGQEDHIVPVQLQRYVCKKLPWIRYHEVPDRGHLIMYDIGLFEAILRNLLLPSGA